MGNTYLQMFAAVVRLLRACYGDSVIQSVPAVTTTDNIHNTLFIQ